MPLSHRAKANLSHELFSQLLFYKTPYVGAEVQGVSYNSEGDTWDIYFSHRDLPKVPEGDPTPYVDFVNQQDQKPESSEE